jgi:hypothetical protein
MRLVSRSLLQKIQAGINRPYQEASNGDSYFCEGTEPFTDNNNLSQGAMTK